MPCHFVHLCGLRSRCRLKTGDYKKVSCHRFATWPGSVRNVPSPYLAGTCWDGRAHGRRMPLPGVRIFVLSVPPYRVKIRDRVGDFDMRGGFHVAAFSSGTRSSGTNSIAAKSNR